MIVPVLAMHAPLATVAALADDALIGGSDPIRVAPLLTAGVATGGRTGGIVDQQGARIDVVAPLLGVSALKA